MKLREYFLLEPAGGGGGGGGAERAEDSVPGSGEEGERRGY